MPVIGAGASLRIKHPSYMWLLSRAEHNLFNYKRQLPILSRIWVSWIMPHTEDTEKWKMKSEKSKICFVLQFFIFPFSFLSFRALRVMNFPIRAHFFVYAPCRERFYSVTILLVGNLLAVLVGGRLLRLVQERRNRFVLRIPALRVLLPRRLSRPAVFFL